MISFAFQTMRYLKTCVLHVILQSFSSKPGIHVILTVLKTLKPWFFVQSTRNDHRQSLRNLSTIS